MDIDFLINTRINYRSAKNTMKFKTTIYILIATLTLNIKEKIDIKKNSSSFYIYFGKICNKEYALCIA